MPAARSPARSLVQTTVRYPPDHDSKMERLAELHYRDKTKEIGLAIKEYIERHSDELAPVDEIDEHKDRP